MMVVRDSGAHNSSCNSGGGELVVRVAMVGAAVGWGDGESYGGVGGSGVGGGCVVVVELYLCISIVMNSHLQI